MSAGTSRGRASQARSRDGVLHTLIALYSSWKTLLTNAVFFAAYYLLFYELILHTNGGYFLLTIPSRSCSSSFSHRPLRRRWRSPT